jgi:uncharacterized protein YbaP (TraB family)
MLMYPWARHCRILRNAALTVAMVLAALMMRAGEAASEENALLWQIDAPDRQGTSYLLGTMHVSDPRIVDNIPTEVYAAMAMSRTAVFELVLGQEGEGAVLQRMTIEDGRYLDDILGKALFDRLKVIAQPYGLIPSALKYLKPWAVFLMMSMPPEETFRQARGQATLDNLLQQHAASLDMTLLPLETLEEQLSVFEGTSEADQIVMMTELVDTKAEMEALYEEILVAYVERDLNAIYALASQTGEGDQELADRFNERLILDRNDRMAERLVPMLRHGGHFVAVGAMHLPGDNGLLQQLRDAGYVVTPLI